MDTKDLSYYSEPLTDLFPEIASNEDLDRYRLPQEQVTSFRENGFLKNVKVLDETQVDRLRADLEPFFDEEHPGRELWYEYHRDESDDPDLSVFHSLGAWRIKKSFHDLLWHPAILVPAVQLLGGSVRFWHDQLFCKPPGHGGVVAWHQDYSYWTRTKPIDHLTCWIGLDDATLENGCMQYVPESHNWDLLPTTDLADDMEAIKQVLSDKQKEMFDPVPVEMKKGEASFHHPLLVHGSYGNTSDRPRRGVVLNVLKDGVRSDTNEPLLQGCPPIPKGEKVKGRFHPLLFENGQNL